MGTLLLDDMADYLSTGGISDTIIRGLVLESPDKAVFIRETGGRAPDHAMSGTAGAVAMEWPHVQIVSRATTYQGARQLAANVYRLLDGMPKRTLNGTTYYWGTALQSPFLLEQDVNNRVLIACNYELAKAASTSTST
jgi:hypothetical protein